MPLLPDLPPRVDRIASRVVGALAALTLLLGLFVVVGARRVDVIDQAEALVAFQSDTTFEGLAGWDRPLDGVRPSPGVYVYATTGGARLNRMGIDRRYPAATTRIITHGPGCQWREEVPIFRQHTETYSACAEDDDQRDTGFGTRLEYFFVPGVIDAVCRPGGTRTGAGMAVGASRTFSCSDPENDVEVAGTVTYRGPGTVRVDDTPLPCRKVEIATVFTGSNLGSAVRELCTLADTGLVLSETRRVGITVDSAFIGSVTYVEEATFTLASTIPLV